MSEATRHAAFGALGSARSAVARLRPGKHPEDAAADLIEAWGSVEAALRALLNGSPLSGQDLVSDVRKREMITLTQTHALLDFLAIRERLNDTSYQPTVADTDVARDAVAQLESALTGPPHATPVAPAPTTGPEPAPPPAPVHEGPVRGRVFDRIPTWGWVLIALVAVAAAGGATWYALAGGDDVTEARTALREGRREAARAGFEKAGRDNPRDAEPHVFLARMAREEGDHERAREHAQAAIRAEPENYLGHREMGTILYATGNYELATRFLERAIRYNHEDRTSQGVMGCALARLGRRDVAARFISRAGPGPWRDCAL